MIFLIPYFQISVSLQSPGTGAGVLPPTQTIPMERPLARRALGVGPRAGLWHSRTLSSSRCRGRSVGKVALLLSTTLNWHIILEHGRREKHETPLMSSNSNPWLTLFPLSLCLISRLLRSRQLYTNTYCTYAPLLPKQVSDFTSLCQ